MVKLIDQKTDIICVTDTWDRDFDTINFVALIHKSCLYYYFK